MRVHLDTDIGGDTDDACALAMLLGRDDVELVGVTTVHDPNGRRAGYVHRLLQLAGRDDVAVGSSDVLRRSIELDALVVGIGPFTNLAHVRPPRVVLMGGWDRPPDVGLPQWGPEMDWNVTCSFSVCDGAHFRVVRYRERWVRANPPLVGAAGRRRATCSRRCRRGRRRRTQ